jgi:hypothetical protein
VKDLEDTISTMSFQKLIYLAELCLQELRARYGSATLAEITEDDE